MIQLDNYEQIIQSPWNYTLYKLNDDYVLEVVCGSVALYNKQIRLSPEEVIAYKNFGEKTLESIAKIAQNNDGLESNKEEKVEAKSKAVTYPFFSFTEDDLLSNKKGVLSESQKKKIRKTGLTILLTFTSLSICISFLILFLVENSLLFAAISLFALDTIGMLFYFKSISASKNGSANAIRGSVKIEYRNKIEYVIINEKAFAFSFAKQVFSEGKIYCVYYSSNNTILSFEVL